MVAGYYDLLCEFTLYYRAVFIEINSISETFYPQFELYIVQGRCIFRLT
jgi:hypothetical protein